MQSDKCIAAATPLDRSWSCGPLWQRVLGLLGFLLLQTPWYIVRWLCSLVQLPALLGEGHVPNDEDVVALMEASVLCMMLTVQPGSSSTSHPDNSSGRCWEQDTLCKFEFRHCQLVSAGRRLHSMSLVYRKQQAGDGQRWVCTWFVLLACGTGACSWHFNIVLLACTGTEPQCARAHAFTCRANNTP